jgi:hypothetical protein
VRRHEPRGSILVALMCLAAIVVADAAGVKVKAEPDPMFDFAQVHTWSWDTDAGEVVMARTQTDDPAPIKARIDPLIRKYVEAEMRQKGLTPTTTGTPDFYLHYYVLVTISSGSQYMGQFLPTVPYWGLPGFSAGATTSLSVATKGSLVLDAMLPGAAQERRVIWRGIAQSTVQDDDPDNVRDTRIREASAGLVKKFPLKQKKK